MSKKLNEFIPLTTAILTVSDTRTKENDTSGHYLKSALEKNGHVFHESRIVKDDIYAMRAAVSQWIADTEIQVILTTGGTGFTGRDSTPEALQVLFDKEILGFGELFRQLSFDEVGTSTIQSRAFAGIANKTLIFCLPGSNNACETAWEKIIKEQLDARHRPCNFVGQVL